MGRHREDTFRRYLEALPDELLESVAEDYVWLADCEFPEEQPGVEFRRRRECCREECIRRGLPHLFRMAEDNVHPWAA